MPHTETRIIARYSYPDRPTRLRLEGGRIVMLRRFIMEMALGRELEKFEIVKTLDRSRPDDEITNLMLVSLATSERPQIELTCSQCGVRFKRPAAQVNLSLHRGCTRFYCSHRCVGLAFGRGRKK